jgi:hypothetical protein
MRGALAGASLLLLLFTGCVYPRRSTSLSPVQRPDASQSLSAPADIFRVTVVSAQIAPRKRGGLAWDDSDGAPDAYVRIFRGGEQIFESSTIDDSLAPEWNATLERNVRIPSTAQLRFEVWDRDVVGSDPIGIYRHQGLPPNAVEDADARLMLENGSFLTVRVQGPRPHRGVGISSYEIRPGALHVLEVMQYSPAERAGIEAGDQIVRIGDRAVSEMNGQQAASALSMCAHRDTALTVRSSAGQERTVDLDRGFVWLTQ